MSGWGRWGVGRYGCHSDGLDEADTVEKEERREGGKVGGKGERDKGRATYLQGIGERVVGVEDLGAHDGWRGAH